MTQTWLFQVNPDRFDVEGFLATRPGPTKWLVTRQGKEMKAGDEVFIWRAAGAGDPGKSGVIAKAEIISQPSTQADDPNALPFWKSSEDRTKVAERAGIRFLRVAKKREVLQRTWLVEDPILRSLAIIKMANATNYKLTEDQVERLNALWEKTGKDWSYAETVAGLWAFVQTYGQSVSKLPGSPVARVALLTGRAIGGVYNKVMNFRSLDPRDTRKGLDGASDADRATWAAFCDNETGAIREPELELEMKRLWPDEQIAPVDEVEALDASVERETRSLLSLSLPELIAMHARTSGARSRKPVARRSHTRVFDREPLVVAIAKIRADFRCEVEGCVHLPFIDDDGHPFCEVHHIHPLAEGGEDTPENVACLCPSHHREVHHGRVAARLRVQLEALRASPIKALQVGT